MRRTQEHETLENERSELNETRLRIQQEIDYETAAIKRDREKWQSEKQKLETEITDLLRKKHDIEMLSTEKRVEVEILRAEAVKLNSEVATHRNIKSQIQQQEEQLRLLLDKISKSQDDSQAMMNEVNRTKLKNEDQREIIEMERKKLASEKCRLESYRIQVTADLKKLSEKRFAESLLINKFGTPLNSVFKKTAALEQRIDISKFVNVRGKVSKNIDDRIENLVSDNWKLREQSEFLRNIQ